MKIHSACLAACEVLATFTPAQGVAGNLEEGEQVPGAALLPTQIHVPNRPSAPLFQGAQGRQKTEIHFDPTTQVVTIRLLVQDPNGSVVERGS